MRNTGFVTGFSKMDREEKIRFVASLLTGDSEFKELVNDHLHPKAEIQKFYQEFSENTLTNYFLPYSIAPNFLIDGKIYHVPMVTEESSVVAAAASAAKFWSDKGGFTCEITGTLKPGYVHFRWGGNPAALDTFFLKSKSLLRKAVGAMTANMNKRGGGVRSIELLRMPEILNDYYQLRVMFDTADAMGANFINSCLEEIARCWKEILDKDNAIGSSYPCKIIMAILSNYTPGCTVRCRVKAPVELMSDKTTGLTGKDFKDTFLEAMIIADQDVSRAVTHNKGIFNGIDAVVLATGNDFRAVEANGHAFAARTGRYRSLSKALIENGEFIMELEVPLSIGTVGGLTSIHPLAKNSLKILNNPSAENLMKIAACAGLANNFSAIRSLITTGIQRGHMRLHLTNILHQLNANVPESTEAIKWFVDKPVSYRVVEEFLKNKRG